MEERIKEAFLKVTIDMLALAAVLEVNKKRYLQEVRKAHKSEIEKCAKNWVEIPF